MPRRISVRDLRVGMTTLTQNPDGSFKKDVRLDSYFTTSSKFPTISFRTQGGIVIWRDCGTVWVQ